MLNLVLFGKPGSGKGTQANFLKDKYNLVHISTGDVFRKNIKNQTELGLKAEAYTQNGELVPDDVTVLMLEDEIKQNLPCKGFIFDGFPRTLYQADEMNKILFKYKMKLSAIVALDVDDDLLTDRLLKRGLISGRSDDQSREKILTRLNEYRNKTEPLIEYYSKINRFHSVSGVGEIHEISLRLLDLIESVK
tara:strand:+ start:210 stop:785 length:576 start_codon:yes stop_codon:yes gene_type:complete